MLKYYKNFFRWWWLTWSWKSAREMADLTVEVDAWLDKLEENQ